MHDLMIDVEALGKPHTGALLQVGAVLFDRAGPMAQFDALGPERTFLATIQLEHINMATVDPDTLRWWLTRTSDQARATVFPEVALEEADLLAQLHTFLVRHAATRVIASQPSYDFGHLHALYSRHDRAAPWPHWAEEGTRELVAYADDQGIRFQRMPSIIHHNALQDAIAQARDYTRLWQALRGRENLAAVSPAPAAATPATG